MAYITKVSGGSQPVFNLDVLNGSVAQTANIAAQGPFNPAGPKLDFYTFTANATMASQGGVNQFVSNVLQALQQVTTVAIAQVGPTPTLLSVATYPTGAFANVALALAQAQTANGTIGISSAVGSATFTNFADLP
jgi:hypothetical protein